MTTAALIHHERSAADKLGAQTAIATHLAQECASQKAQLAKHRAARARLLQKLKIERQRTRAAMAMHAEAVAAGEKDLACMREFQEKFMIADHALREMCEDLRPLQEEFTVEAWGKRLSKVAMMRLALAKADTARIDCLARHPLKAAIKGGPDDGAEARVWAVSGDPSWNLRQVIDSLRVKDGEKL